MQYELIKIDQDELKKLDGIKSEFKIENIEITNDDEYKNNADLVKKVKGKIKEVEAVFAEPKAAAYKNHKDISSMEKEYKEHLEEFEKIGKKAIGEYMLQLEKQNTAVNPISAPKVKGISASDVYRWEIIDKNLIPPAMGNIWLWTIDEKAITNYIKLTNGSVEIPGINIIKEKSVSVKGE